MTTGEDGDHDQRRPATMQDVADHIGVSRQLVSMVVRGLPGPSPQSRARILSAASELGYRPNASARLLRQNRTGLVGVLFSMRHPFQIRVVERLFARAAESGLALALGPITPERSEDVVIAGLMEQRVEAIVAFNPDPGSAALQEAIGSVPLVWLGEWADDARVDNVHVDEREGFRQAIEHLVSEGHRDIAYAGGGGGRVGRDRAEAYSAEMTAAGLASHARIIASDFSEEGGANAGRAIASAIHRPTAVLCCGDQCATGLLAVLALSGVRVPDDISVVGFDDSYLAALSYQDLTSIHQDVEETVDAVLAAVLDRLADDEGDRRVVSTATTLVVRGSTAGLRSDVDRASPPRDPDTAS